MISRILTTLCLAGLAVPGIAAAQWRADRGNQEFVEAFVLSERAKLVAKVHKEGDQFDTRRELDKLRQKHEKVFGSTISESLLADFERLARDAPSQSPDPALIDPDSGKRRDPREVYPELYLAGAKVKFLEDIREEGTKFQTEKELAKVAERFERNFGTPFPTQQQSDLNRIAEQARTVILQQREANAAAVISGKSSNAPPAATSRSPSSIVIRGVRYPAGLPDWFAEHDTNQDGQVALYEWEREKLAEFTQWDLNSDGFLEPLEVLRRFQKLNPSKSGSKQKSPPRNNPGDKRSR